MSTIRAGFTFPLQVCHHQNGFIDKSDLFDGKAWQIRLTYKQQEDLQKLQEAESELRELYHLAQAFFSLIRDHSSSQLTLWMANALQCQTPELRSFARGLERDESAVRAGLDLPWSQGQTEGQITRLKLIKRQGYGRAKFDLLRQRVLHAA